MAAQSILKPVRADQWWSDSPCQYKEKAYVSI